MSEIPAQYTGPLYINDAKSITNYQPPTTKDDQRIDSKIMNIKLPKFPVNPVPQIEDPIIDDIPKDYVLYTDISGKEKAEVYLENGSKKYNWYEIKPSNKKPNLSPLANHPVAQIFVGCVSVLGLFMVFRALKL